MDCRNEGECLKTKMGTVTTALNVPAFTRNVRGEKSEFASYQEELLVLLACCCLVCWLLLNQRMICARAPGDLPQEKAELDQGKVALLTAE